MYLFQIRPVTQNNSRSYSHPLLNTGLSASISGCFITFFTKTGKSYLHSQPNLVRTFVGSPINKALFVVLIFLQLVSWRMEITASIPLPIRIQLGVVFLVGYRNVNPIFLFSPCSKIRINVESCMFPLAFSSLEI